MRRVLASLAAVAVLAPTPAEAGVADDGVIISTVIIGALAGTTNTVAALVYGLEERTFDVPWVVSSMFSTGVCGSLAISFVVDAGSSSDVIGPLIGVLFFAALAAIPSYWTIKSALAEADPGEQFDAPLLEAEARPEVRDPMDRLTPNAPRPAMIIPLGFNF